MSDTHQDIRSSPWFKVCLLLIVLVAVPLMAQSFVILSGQVIDGKSSSPLSNAAVVVEGNRIVAVGKQAAIPIPSNAIVIDLGTSTVLPGLIDAHVHPLIAVDDYQVYHVKHSSAAKALRGLKRVQEFLEAGWTSLRIAGDADVYYAHLDIRDAINEGLFVGPRIFGAGHYLSATGGGGDINFIAPEQDVIADGLVVDGVDEMRRAIRKEIKYGSDWIKLLVTGAFMSAGDDPRQVHFSPEELKIAVEEAGRRGVPVMAHAHSTDGIKQAVLAGVRSIEHGTFIDEETTQLIIERGTYLIPTLYIRDYFLDEIPTSVALKKAIDLTRKYKEDYLVQYRLAIRRGVKVGVGSDNVGFPATYGTREFAALVNVGMSPMQAIQAGTRVNAELLNMEHDLGTIEPGKLADIIAVAGNPLEDMSELERVTFVMLGGKVVKTPLRKE